MAKDDLTAQELREQIHYDPETGVFRRLVASSHSPRGAILGYINNNTGRVEFRVLSRKYLAHRLAWLYMTGKWPAQFIDHINGNPIDNRFANLRDVDHSTNLQNQRAARRGCATGFLGVRIYRGGRSLRYLARITFNGKRIHCGSFKTAEEAYAAYLEAKRRLHKGCTI